MMTANEVTKVFEAILSSPGMNDTVRIDHRISRKNVLLLSQVIHLGLSGKDTSEGMLLLANSSDESLNELHGFADDCLAKAGLTELSEKLQQFSQQPQKQ